MSIFRELKRRNVFRVGLAYAVAAWVLLQIFDVIGDILELPAWGGKLILAMLIVGFFMALFFAWAFELTPEGIKREAEVDRSQSITPQTGKKLNNAILLLMAVAIAYLLFDKFYLAPRLADDRVEDSAAAEPAVPAPAAESAAPEPVSRQSIAVLPFDNRSRLEEDEFFVAGIHDDLLTNLARIGSLKVISRTSVSQYKDTEKTIPQIAGELGVATIMEGAVQRSGATVRINVQLIDAQTDEHLWAEIFDRELTADNLFAIQSEISAEIAKALEATLSPEEQQRLSEQPTENLAAYNAYLRGRQLMARRNSEDIDQAAKEFQRAVELDPDFALAWVGIAETSMLQVGYSNLSLADSVQRREEATRRALELDDQLGEAYLSLAELHAHHGRNADADVAYRKAIELSPGYATAYMWYATFLRGQSPARLQEALTLGQQAVELDPLSSIVRLSMASGYLVLGHYEQGEKELREVLEMDPEFAPAYAAMAGLLWETGRLAEEVDWDRRALALDPGRLQQLINLGLTYLDLGHPDAFLELRERMADVNDQSFFVGFADLAYNAFIGNDAGAREAARWTRDRAAGSPDVLVQLAWLYTLAGDYPAARETLLAAEPSLLDPGRWPAFIEARRDTACVAGWVLMRTGDEQAGADLLAAAADYLENELPKYIEHADRAEVYYCQAPLGERDKALAAIETRFAHGHYGGWWLLRRMAQMEPLWGDPRFEAALQRVEAEMAVQREEVIRTEAAGTVRL